MVWGMSLPDSFGKSWPLGSFDPEEGSDEEGWRERLQRYCREEMDGERRSLFFSGGHNLYSRYVIDKFNWEMGKVHVPNLPALNPIEEHEPPIFFQTEKNTES